MLNVREFHAQIRRWSPPLGQTAIINVALLLLALALMAVDHRLIGGAPAWLKPVKFGASGALYLVSLAFLVHELPPTRAVRIAVRLVGWILVVETVLVFVQAARGTASHFNIGTPLDAAIFSAMGVGIGTVWVMTMVLLWQHCRTRATDRAMALALRLGLILNIIGAGVGWTMTQPRPDQLAAMTRGERPALIGAHSVGGRDGGPGLPVTRWSVEHGDLRVPHFVGLHALQLLPLLLLGVRSIRSSRDDAMERTLILGASAACATLFGAALLQALSGAPLVSMLTT
jgi:hypothetical protein